MASSTGETKEGFTYIDCPYRDITGCEIILIVNGYCSAGKYCVKNCLYAWSSIENNA